MLILLLVFGVPIFIIIMAILGGILNLRDSRNTNKAINSIDYSKIEEALIQRAEYQNIIYSVTRSNAVNGVEYEWLHPEWTWAEGEDSFNLFTRTNLNTKLLEKYSVVGDKFIEMFKEVFKELYPREGTLCDKTDNRAYEYDKFIQKYIAYISIEIANNLNKMVLEKTPIAEFKMKMLQTRLKYELSKNLAEIRKGIARIEEVTDAIHDMSKIKTVLGADAVENPASVATRIYNHVKRNNSSKASDLVSYISRLYFLAYYYPAEYKKIGPGEFIATKKDLELLLDVVGASSFYWNLDGGNPFFLEHRTRSKDWWSDIHKTLGNKNFKSE